jgi:hypothetical protein
MAVVPGRVFLCCRQGSDLYDVVGKHAVAAPCGCAVESGDAGAGPAVAVFEVADAALASGSPLDELAEPSTVFGCSLAVPGWPFRGMETAFSPIA